MNPTTTNRVQGQSNSLVVCGATGRPNLALRRTPEQTQKRELDTNYHPPTVNLDSWQKSNPNSAPSLFYWQGEEVNGATPVMHFQMIKRAYEQMLALVAGSDLRVRPSQTSSQKPLAHP